MKLSWYWMTMNCLSLVLAFLAVLGGCSETATKKVPATQVKAAEEKPTESPPPAAPTTPPKSDESATTQATGELGSPSATASIPGKQIPPPDPKFGGVIKEKAAESKPWWSPRVVPPKATL